MAPLGDLTKSRASWEHCRFNTRREWNIYEIKVVGEDSAQWLPSAGLEEKGFHNVQQSECLPLKSVN
jgi:hypothetical protein